MDHAVASAPAVDGLLSTTHGSDVFLRPPTMAHNSAQWKRIENLLDQVLDLREASARAREAKVKRLLARNSTRRGGSKPPPQT
jgi:hypothetical protein